MLLLLGLGVAPKIVWALVVDAAASGVVDSCVAVASCVTVIEVDVITVGAGIVIQYQAFAGHSNLAQRQRLQP